MAIFVQTESPRKLLSEIINRIDNGRIKSWIIDSDYDLTFSDPRWTEMAWMHPYIVDEGIIFGIVAPSDSSISIAAYGIFHGRLVEMLLIHFDEWMRNIKVSSQPTPYDSLA